MATIEFYPLEAGYTLKGGSPVVQIYGRDSQGKRVVVLDDSFAPYFWVVPEKAPAETASEIAKEKLVVGAEVVEKKFVGTHVKAIRVTVKKPADVVQLRDSLKKYGQVLEADILFTRRYFMDHKVIPLTLYEAEGEQTDAGFVLKKLTRKEDKTPELKMLAIDIETYNAQGKMPNAREDPIIMLAIAGKRYKKVLTWQKFTTEHDWIEFVKDEKELLERFVALISEQEPDILTGYFTDGFDLPYISTRTEKLKVKMSLGLDGSELKVSRGAGATSADITGMTHLDILNFIRKVHKVALKTPVYDLNSVAKEILGEGKVQVEITELFKAWDSGKGLEHFCEYNMQDAKLTYKLSETLLPNAMEFAKLVGLPLSETSRLSFSQIVEWYLMRQAPDFNELAPNRPGYGESSTRRETRYEGGFVYEPKPGLYHDIAVFDFLSLYPTIIASHNISPDTLKHKDCKKKEQIDDLWFCQDEPGFIASVIGDVIERRQKVKNELKKKDDKLLEGRAQALKTVANSIYGYLGFFGARWYSGECARGITAFGRQHIKHVIESAKKEGFSVLYSDTDSIFLSLEGRKKKEALDFMEKINTELPGIMELEYESFYKTGIFVATRVGGGAKKKYAMLGEDGSIKIRGFQTVRRNLSVIAKETQKKVLEILLKEEDAGKATAYVKKVVKRLREHDVPVEKTVITTQLQRAVKNYEAVGPHVAVARRMEEKGLDVGPGSIISYVITTHGKKIRDKAKLPEDVTAKDYDSEYYISNQVLPVVESILDVFGVSAEELANNHKQSTLGSFS